MFRWFAKPPNTSNVVILSGSKNSDLFKYFADFLKSSTCIFNPANALKVAIFAGLFCNAFLNIVRAWVTFSGQYGRYQQ